VEENYLSVDPFVVRTLVFSFGFVAIILILAYQVLSEDEAADK
jgi:hypothetical protein